MLEKLTESKALRERDLVVADRRRLAIMVEDVWLALRLKFSKTGVARSRQESSRNEIDSVFSFLANQQHRSEVESSYFINYHTR